MPSASTQSRMTFDYKWAGHRLGIHRELFEKQEARVSGPVTDAEDTPDEDDEPQTPRGPLSIAEVFGLKPT